MKLLKIICLSFLCLLCKSAIAQNKFGIRLFVTPKACINNTSNAEILYYAASGTNSNLTALYNRKSSMSLTIDYSFLLKYNITNSFSVEIGAGKTSVKQAYKVLSPLLGMDCKKVRSKYCLQKVPLVFEKRFSVNNRSKFIVDLGCDFLFDAFSNNFSYRSDNELREIKGIKPQQGENYRLWIVDYNWSTFNPILSLGVGYEYLINKKFSFISTLDVKQGFKPQINTRLDFYEEFGMADDVKITHIYSDNYGQSINLNLGVEYKF